MSKLSSPEAVRAHRQALVKACMQLGAVIEHAEGTYSRDRRVGHTSGGSPQYGVQHFRCTVRVLGERSSLEVYKTITHIDGQGTGVSVTSITDDWLALDASIRKLLEQA